MGSDHYHIWAIKIVAGGRVAAYRDNRPFLHRTQAYRVVNRDVGLRGAMVLQCNGVKCKHGASNKNALAPPAPPAGGWAEWATMRAERVRTDLPADRWGLWATGGICSKSGLSLGHPSEEPYFFHCVECLERYRKINKVIPKVVRKEVTLRDRGLCIQCGESAVLNEKGSRISRIECAEAEALGTTVARLLTRRYCDSCSRAQLYTL